MLAYDIQSIEELGNSPARCGPRSAPLVSEDALEQDIEQAKGFTRATGDAWAVSGGPRGWAGTHHSSAPPGVEAQWCLRCLLRLHSIWGQHDSRGQASRENNHS